MIQDASLQGQPKVCSYHVLSVEAPVKEPLAARCNILLAAAADKAASEKSATHPAAHSGRPSTEAPAALRPVAAKTGSGPAHVGIQVSRPTLSLWSGVVRSAKEVMQACHPAGRHLLCMHWSQRKVALRRMLPYVRFWV